jgi:hypothetical protein
MSNPENTFYEPVQRGEMKRLYRQPKFVEDHLVRCPCGGDRWRLELIGDKTIGPDGIPTQDVKYFCANCEGGLVDARQD